MTAQNNFIFREHGPIEIFGYHPDDARVLSQREGRKCPFTNEKCIKQLYRTDKPPSGCCSVSHNGENIIICPKRFSADNNRIIYDIAKLLLKTNDITLINEVGLPEGFGRVDWVAMSQENFGSIKYIPIETHANQTTSTGGLTDAIGEHEATGILSLTRYKYGLNTYHQIKTFFTQCLQKSQLFEKWNRNFVWILDDSVFKNWLNRFSLKLDPLDLNNRIFFFTYGLEFNKVSRKYDLIQKSVASSNRMALLEAYNRGGDDLPSENEFIKNILSKMGNK